MRCWLEVSRACIAENFRAVVELVGPDVEVMPVVKAEAYGHGAVEVSRVLEAQGARLAGKYAYQGAMLGAAGSLLTGGAQTLARAQDYRYRGTGNSSSAPSAGKG